MVTRGYRSMSFLYSAAATMRDRFLHGDDWQSAVIYYFGDRDPSGVDIDRAVRRGIGEAVESMIGESAREPTPEDEFDVFVDLHRVAVTEDQIVDWNLPTRPTKRTDSRSKNFIGDSVELDAIPVDALRSLAESVIRRQVDQDQLEILQAVEAEERRGLMALARKPA
jgi:hypothetical protein